jgi:hypothetical protein
MACCDGEAVDTKEFQFDAGAAFQSNLPRRFADRHAVLAGVHRLVAGCRDNPAEECICVCFDASSFEADPAIGLRGTKLTILYRMKRLGWILNVQCDS